MTARLGKAPAHPAAASRHLSATRRSLVTLGAFLIVLAAYALRLYHLNLQALTGDEAFSMVAAARWFTEEMNLYGAGSIEPTPPLHFLLLAVWTRVAGDSEFVGRFLSLAAGVLLVPTSYQLGRRLGGARLGLAFAALVAANPFLILHAQTIRFFSLAAWLSALSMLCLVRLLDALAGTSGESDSSAVHRVERWHVAAYLLATLLMLYTHSLAALLLVSQSAAFLLWSGARRRWRLWVGLQAIIGLLYLPWAIRAVGLFATPYDVWIERGGIVEVLGRLFASFSFGGSAALTFGIGALRVAPDSMSALALVAIGLVLFAVGVVAGVRSAKAGGGRFAALYLLVPLAIVIAMTVKATLLRDRYMMPFLPGYLLGIAVGCVALGRRRLVVGLAALALALLPAFASLPAYYRTTVYVSTAQVRALQSYIAANARPNSVAIVNLPPSDPFFMYYRLAVPTMFVSDARPADREAGLPALKDAVAKSGEVWLLPFGYGSESDHFVESYLNSAGFKTEDRWFGNLRLVRYATADSGDTPRQSADAAFVHPNGRIRLAGYRVSPATARAGGVLSLTLYWRADGPTADRYKVFVHFDDASGRTRVQQDAEPAGGKRPTTGFLTGEEIADNYGLPLPPDLPPGEYTVDIGLYQLDGGTRLTVANGENHHVVAKVTVAP